MMCFSLLFLNFFFGFFLKKEPKKRADSFILWGGVDLFFSHFQGGKNSAPPPCLPSPKKTLSSRVVPSLRSRLSGFTRRRNGRVLLDAVWRPRRSLHGDGVPKVHAKGKNANAFLFRKFQKQLFARVFADDGWRLVARPVRVRVVSALRIHDRGYRETLHRWIWEFNDLRNGGWLYGG